MQRDGARPLFVEMAMHLEDITLTIQTDVNGLMQRRQAIAQDVDHRPVRSRNEAADLSLFIESDLAGNNHSPAFARALHPRFCGRQWNETRQSPRSLAQVLPDPRHQRGGRNNARQSRHFGGALE